MVAVRGVGAAALVMEAVVLLLAVLPLTRLHVRHGGLALAAVLALVVVSLVLAAMTRYRWAWYAAVGLQVALAVCGVFHLSLLVLGLLFGAVWAYVLSVRRRLLGRV